MNLLNISFAFPAVSKNSKSYCLENSQNREEIGTAKLVRTSSGFRIDGSVFGEEFQISGDEYTGEAYFLNNDYSYQSKNSLFERRLFFSNNKRILVFKIDFLQEEVHFMDEDESLFALDTSLNLSFRVFINTLTIMITLGVFGKKGNTNTIFPDEITNILDEVDYPAFFLSVLLIRMSIYDHDFAYVN